MKKVRDYISIPPVDTVIQVSAVERLSEAEVREKIFESFVVTDDIRKGLIPVLADSVKERGRGFLLKGSYGSGKSHFIAYLCSILNYPHLMEKAVACIPELSDSVDAINEKKILPVSLSLTDYSSVNTLADIVTEKIAKVFSENFIGFDLPDIRRQVSEFKERILPAVRDEFNDFISGADFDNNPPALQRDIINSFLSLQNSSLRLFCDYNELFNSLDDVLQEKYPGGIFIFIDELSEFLRARGRGELVSEDIRFIQFMGEKCSASRLRVLLAMQENIEEVATISADGLNRIKDRYPVRINLSVLHLRELVEKRLLVKKEGSRGEIVSIYNDLLDAFPRLRINEDDFISMYPVHPETFRMLEGIAGLFSKTRGLVDFIVTEVAGDIARGIPGILDNECDSLLSPDRIFDHFRNNLEESIEYNWLMSVLFSSMERDVPLIFSEKRDADLASRILKLIMLFQILPGSESPTAQHLANLTIDKRSRLDPEVNYTFVRDKILRRLERETPFISVNRGITELEDSFFFQQDENPFLLFEKKTQQFIQKNPGREKQALWFFISRLRDERLPLSDLKGGGQFFRFIFENTGRESLVMQKALKSLEPEELNSLRRKLAVEEIDAVIIIGYPVDEPEEKSLYFSIIDGAASEAERAIVFIKPRPPGEGESEMLVKGYAMASVYEENVDLKWDESSRVSEMVNEAMEKCGRIIIGLYSEARLFHCSSNNIEEDDLLLSGSLGKTVEIITKPLLKKIFPYHSKIAPGSDVASRETYNQIIKLFSEKESIDFNFEGTRALKTTIDSLFPNKGVIQKVSGEYRIAPDPGVNSFIREVLSYIRNNEISFDRLYLHFRKGPWGIKRNLFALYLFILYQAGFISLERGGRPVRGRAPDLAMVESCDLIRTGDDLSPLFLERYDLLGPFAEGLTSKKIHLQVQNKVWDDLVAFKREKEGEAAGLLEEIKNIEAFPVFRNHPPAKIKKSVEIINQFLAHIYVSKNSKEGLQELLEYLGDFPEISLHFDIYKKFKGFRNIYFDRIVFAYDYLFSPEIVPFERLKEKYLSLIDEIRSVEDFIIDGKIEDILSGFDLFREEYSICYAERHGEIQASSEAAEFEGLKQTASYRVLYNLSRIETLSVENDLIRVDEIINSVSASVCRRPVLQELKRKPYCECRLLTDDPEHNAGSLAEMIRGGVKEYLALIQGEDNRRKIVSYAGSMSDDEEQDGRMIIRELMALDPEEIDDSTLLRLVCRSSIDIINRALAGRLRVEKRDLKEFTNAVYGRRYRRQDLIKIFEKWLTGGIENNTGEEIIYELSNPLAEDYPAVIPPVIYEDLRKCVRTNSESLRVSTLAFFYLFNDIPGINAADLISRTLFVDFDDKELTLLIDRYAGFVEGVKKWEGIIDSSLVNDVMRGAEIDSLNTDSLMTIFSRAGAFPAVMEHILEIIIANERKIAVDEIKPPSGGEEYYEVIRRYINFLECKKKFYRESGKRDGFSLNYFLASARIVMASEKLRSIAFHNNILAEKISSEIMSVCSGVISEAEEYFAEIIPAFEKKLSPGLIISRIETLSPLLIVFDSLRMDLFLEMVSLLNSEGIGCSGPELYCSPYPSNTINYRNELFPGIVLESGIVFEFNSREWIYISAAERDYRKNHVREMLHSNSVAGIILWISLLDEKIHSAKQDLSALSREIEIFCRGVFIPLLREVPSSRTICITADHGFVENSAYSGKGEPRYSHGGNSFMERLVPFVKCRKK